MFFHCKLRVVEKKKSMGWGPFRKGKKLYSILHFKCPQCHEGKLFLFKNPYNLKNIDKMPSTCLVCGEDFVRENGFYYGALMISHALTTVICVIIHSVVYYFYGWNPTPHIIFLVTIILGLMPIMFRTARAVWINLFVSFDSKKIKE